MAVYDKGAQQLNGMERRVAGVTKRLDMGTVPEGLVADDIIIIGALPRESVTTDIRILLHEAFNGTTPSLELGYYDYESGTFVVFAVVTTAAMDAADFQIVIPMPVTGNIDLAGAAYTGDRGGIWNGPKETVLAIKWTGGATSPTTGELDVVTSHEYYGTKSGQYGSFYVPMKPSRA